MLGDSSVTHERQVYGILDLFGDLGGVQSVMFMICGALLSPISEHSFFIKAISKLYLARTKDNSLFADRKSKKAQQKLKKNQKVSKTIDLKEAKSFSRNRVIKFSVRQKVNLYFQNMFSGCFNPNDDKLWRLFSQGQERLEKEFDAVYLIRSLRNLKVFMKDQFLNMQLKLKLKNHNANVIEIEEI